jgi:hypothetical protein
MCDKDKSASAALVADPSLLSTTSIISCALSSAESVQESAILARADRRGDTAGRVGEGRVGVGGAEGVGEELELERERDLGLEGLEGVTGTEGTGELDFEREGDPVLDLDRLVERDLDFTESLSLSESESESD